MRDSRLSGFHRLSVAGRIDALAERGFVDADTAARLKAGAALLDRETAARMIENVIGVFGLPLGVAPNFLVNGREHVVPMAVEEPSIVAGVSNAARLVRDSGGFRVTSTDPLLTGQILVTDVADVDAAIGRLEAARGELLALADAGQPRLAGRGGGARDLEVRRHALPDGRAEIVLHLAVDTRDAMGANLVNSMCEALAPRIERIAGGRAVLKILSNLADRSLICAEAAVSLEALGGKDAAAIRDDIVLANRFASTDPHRAATHNKGIMNGIDAVAIATGNDWRAIEAGAHAYAARDGRYRALTEWLEGPDGGLHGRLVLPLRVGTVGGAQRVSPGAALGLVLAGSGSSTELAELMGAVGLAQNLAALRALVTEGIQRGHMRLHARSVAAGAGAPPEHFDRVVEALVETGDVKDWKAAELLESIRRESAGEAPVETVPREAQGTAAGKVILLGEHAAVYDRHVLAVPIERAAAATVRKADGPTRLVVSEPDGTQTFVADAGADGAGGMLAFIVGRLGLAGPGFEVRLSLRVPAAMGLGSSAAAAVAVIRAFDAALALGLDDASVDRIAFDCEKLAHGDPSGIDNTLATLGRPVLFRRGASPPVRLLDLEAPLPLVVAASGARGVTREQVLAVRRRVERLRREHEALFDRIDALTLAGAEALSAGDYATLGALMNVCHGYLNALQVSTPELERMVHVARAHGAAGAKLTGAGGGGSIAALCPGSEARVARALAEAGYRIVSLAAGAA